MLHWLRRKVVEYVLPVSPILVQADAFVLEMIFDRTLEEFVTTERAGDHDVLDA